MFKRGCPHPADRQRRVPDQLGPMLYDTTTRKHHAKVLTWALHCDDCGREVPDTTKEDKDERD